MKKDIFINIDDFKSIFEIEIENIPNQEFDLNINEKTYTIELRELNERIYITISRDTEILCLNSNIKLNVDLIYFSADDIAFFFLQKNNKWLDSNFKIENLVNDLGFYYGII